MLRFENGTCPVGHNALDKAAEVAYTVLWVASTWYLSARDGSASQNVARVWMSCGSGAICALHYIKSHCFDPRKIIRSGGDNSL